MQHFRGGSEFRKYKSIFAPDQSQIVFTSIKATKCVNICQFMFFYSSFLLYSMFLIII